MATLRALAFALLIAQGFAQTNTTNATATPTPSSNATEKMPTHAPTSTPMPTQPPYESGTYKLMNGNTVCAEITMAVSFEIDYINTNDDTATAKVVLPSEDDGVNVTGTCADRNMSSLKSEIILSWSNNNFNLKFDFEGTKPPTAAPTTVQPATPTTNATSGPTTNATSGTPTTQAPSTVAPTTVAPTTVAPTTTAPPPLRRRLLGLSADDEGESRLDMITFTYNTGDRVFVNPKNAGEFTVETRATDKFKFKDGTQLQCKTEQSLQLNGTGSDGVSMDIKDVQFSPFEAAVPDGQVTECSADKGGLTTKLKIIIGVCAGVGGLLILILLIVVLSRCCKRSGYKSV